MSAEKLRRGDRLAAVAEACRRLHSARRFLQDFDMFTIQRGYLQIVQERGFRLPDTYLGFEPQVRALEEADARARRGDRPVQQRPARGELHRGRRRAAADRLRVLGHERRCFELGNVWSESNLSLDQLEELIAHYYGRPLRNKSRAHGCGA